MNLTDGRLTPSRKTMEKSNRYIYSLLVESEQDIVGHVAYSLYKADKIAYIDKYKKDHDGQEPSQQKLDEFQEYSGMEQHLQWYKMKAVTILQGFMDNTMKETLNQLEADFNSSHREHLAAVIEPIKPRSLAKQFWYGILQSILGAFFFAIIVAAFQFIKNYSPKDDLINVPESNEIFPSSKVTSSPTDTTCVSPINPKD